jgi:hypothetical protein
VTLGVDPEPVKALAQHLAADQQCTGRETYQILPKPSHNGLPTRLIALTCRKRNVSGSPTSPKTSTSKATIERIRCKMANLSTDKRVQRSKALGFRSALSTHTMPPDCVGTVESARYRSDGPTWASGSTALFRGTLRKLDRGSSPVAGAAGVNVGMTGAVNGGTTGGVNVGTAGGVTIGMTASVARLVGTAPPGNNKDGTSLGAGCPPIVT